MDGQCQNQPTLFRDGSNGCFTFPQPLELARLRQRWQVPAVGAQAGTALVQSRAKVNWWSPVCAVFTQKTRRKWCLLGTKLALKRRWGGRSEWGASWGFGGARSVGLGTRWQGAGISTCHRCSATCSGQSWDRCPRCHKAQQWREAAALPVVVEQRLLHFSATARAQSCTVISHSED